MSDSEFGEWVHTQREALGLSLEALGQLTGLSHITISDVEAGRTELRASTRSKLEHALTAPIAGRDVERIIFNVLADYSSDMDWLDSATARLSRALRESGLLR